MRRSLHTSVAVLAAVLGALLLAGTATAKQPCWQSLIDDWYDGRIDNVYPVPCYRAALEHMPEDVANYSTLEDDINRALQATIASQGSNGGGSGNSGSGGSNGETGSGAPAKKTGSPSFYGGPKSERGGALLAAGGRDEGGPLPSAINSIGPSSADAVPVPLMVLGGLSALLLSLGAAGFVARRMQTRRAAIRAGAKG